VSLKPTDLRSPLRFLVHDSKNHIICKNTILETNNASWFEQVFPCLRREQAGPLRPVDEVVQEDEIVTYSEDFRDESQEQPKTREVEIRSKR
jgi:N-acyl-L-homoserine lactone synthetase